MPSLTADFDGSIPALYDRHLGPLIFEPSAIDLARRVADARPRRVLEVACGTGRVTRQLHAMLPDDVEIVATDLSPSMLAYARATISHADRITWQEADGLALPFPDGHFDVVLCQYGLMFFPDEAAGIREMGRVVSERGHLFVSTWDRMEVNRFAQVVHECIGRGFPDDPPQFMTIPFRLHDRGALYTMAVEAGFPQSEVLVLPHEGEGVSAQSAARGFVRGNPILVRPEQRGADLAALESAVAEGLAALGGEAPLRLALQTLLLHGQRGSPSPS